MRKVRGVFVQSDDVLPDGIGDGQLRSLLGSGRDDAMADGTGRHDAARCASASKLSRSYYVVNCLVALDN